MNPNKRNIPNITREVYLKHIVPFTKEALASRFELAKRMVISDLLQHLLQHEPAQSDFETIELVDSMKHDGDDVYYCSVKIGKLVVGGNKNMLKSLLKMKNIYVFFTPEEEFISPDEVQLNCSPKKSFGSIFGFES
jgi:hypothetical protein